MEIQCSVCVRVFVCMCIWLCVNSANFPFRWALICVQASRGRVSAPYSTDAALEGDGRGLLPAPYMEVLEFPPTPVTGQPIFIHLTFSSCHRKADGVVGEVRARRWREGGRTLRSRHVSESDRHHLRVTHLNQSTQPVFHFTRIHVKRTYVHMDTYVYMCKVVHSNYHWHGQALYK